MDLEDEEAVEVGVERVVSAAHEAIGTGEKGGQPRLQLLLMTAPEVVAKQRQVRLVWRSGLIVGPCHSVGALEEVEKAARPFFPAFISPRKRFVFTLCSRVRRK